MEEKPDDSWNGCRIYEEKMEVIMYCAWKVNAYEVNEFKRNIIVNLDSFSLFQLILALNSPPLLFRFIFRFWAEIYNFLS